jgi:hypothetical protein
MDGLNEFFKEPTAETPEETPEVVEAPEVEAEQPETAERPRGPDGKFISKGETPETPVESASPAPTEPPLDHAALLGERRRRQELEAKLAEMEARLAPQPAPQPQPEGPPDQWEDPDGYQRYVIEQAKAEARAEAMQVFQYQRIEASATAARQALPDYDEKIAEFGRMVQTNPTLIEQMHRAPNPAEFAYNSAKTNLEISQYGGIDGLINARVAEALKAQAPAALTPTIPETLADAQSARGSSAAWAPRPLEDFLGPRRK